jgi:glutamate racemase
MKLGVFDSGLGGLLITKAIQEAMPDLDVLYLGDTLHLPYGNRSEEAIYAYTIRCVDYLFRQNCKLIVIACNTASASALRKLQQGYLIENYPDRRILGVVVPTIEAAIDAGHDRLGLIGTNYTINSNVYEFELQKINPSVQIFQIGTPLLVPLIEYDGFAWIDSVLEKYLEPFCAQAIQSLILSCTHYACLKARIAERYNFSVISQDDIIPAKLLNYLERHPEISGVLDRGSQARYMVTDLTHNYIQAAHALYGAPIALEKINIG